MLHVLLYLRDKSAYFSNSGGFSAALFISVVATFKQNVSPAAGSDLR
jgi:hypothetical protein